MIASSPIIDKEFQSLLVPLDEKEKARLEASLRRHGCRDPLSVWKGTNILLDGHNRLEICERANISYKTVEIDLPSREHARLWIEDNQAARRNLSEDVKAIIWASIYRREAKLAVDEKLAKARTAKADRKDGKKPSMEATVASIEPKERTRAAISKRAGLSERRLRSAIEIGDKSPEMDLKIRHGELSIAEAKREIKNAELNEKLNGIRAMEAKALRGVYDCVNIDPPWPEDKIERDTRPEQGRSFYWPHMSLDQIREDVRLKLPHFEKDCHVFLWATQTFLRPAFDLLDHWGLKYICMFIWFKNGGPQPFDLPQYNSEFVLYARKGSPKWLTTKAFPTCFKGARRRHGQKPEEWYATLRRVTGGRRLDMYNREKIQDFDGWGWEAPEA